jgi:tetratricopeptide (TPR) repeat protein
MTETAAAFARAAAGDLARAEVELAQTHERFRAADDAPAAGGALLMWGLAVEAAGEPERAADLFAAGAEAWEHGLTGAFPGWGLYAAGDALHNVGRSAEAHGCISRAERILRECGETRVAALCTVHPAVKAALSPGKGAAS